MLKLSREKVHELEYRIHILKKKYYTQIPVNNDECKNVKHVDTYISCTAHMCNISIPGNIPLTPRNVTVMYVFYLQLCFGHHGTISQAVYVIYNYKLANTNEERAAANIFDFELDNQSAG